MDVPSSYRALENQPTRALVFLNSASAFSKRLWPSGFGTRMMRDMSLPDQSADTAETGKLGQATQIDTADRGLLQQGQKLLAVWGKR